MDEPATGDDVALAERLLAAWQDGAPKRGVERETWGDGSAHGRRFDRFIFTVLGVKTTERSKQALRIELLERQVRGLGHHPAGREPEEWERARRGADRRVVIAGPIAPAGLLNGDEA